MGESHKTAVTGGHQLRVLLVVFLALIFLPGCDSNEKTDNSAVSPEPQGTISKKIEPIPNIKNTDNLAISPKQQEKLEKGREIKITPYSDYPKHFGLIVVDWNNDDYKLLKDHKDKKLRAYATNNIIKPIFSEWMEIPTKPLQELFPDYRFYVIYWNEQLVDKTAKMRVSCAAGLQQTAVIHSKTRKMILFPGFGNYEKYGDFLAKEKIVLCDDGKAKLIWDSFCDLHQKRWKNQGIKKISYNQWHLGITEGSRSKYYYEVNLNDEGYVLNGRLHSVPLKN
jgi:hypothetical protein